MMIEVKEDVGVEDAEEEVEVKDVDVKETPGGGMTRIRFGVIFV